MKTGDICDIFMCTTTTKTYYIFTARLSILNRLNKKKTRIKYNLQTLYFTLFSKNAKHARYSKAN